MTIQFQVGQTYSTASACDHNCIYRVKIVGRTAKQLIIEQHGKQSKRGILVRMDNNQMVERCYFSGRYSMAPCISADDTRERKSDWQ